MTKHVTTCAALPMYDWPEEHAHSDALWSHLRSTFKRHHIQAPDTLDRTRDTMRIWQDEGLLLSQTCGLPYADFLRATTSILGIPVFELDGLDNWHYSSQIIVRKNDRRSLLADFRDCRLVINDPGSQSGFNAMRLLLHKRELHPSFFSSLSASGSHRASLLKVAANEADICAVDPVSWHLAKHHEPEAVTHLKVIDQTPMTPALPYICSNRMATEVGLDQIRNAISDALQSLPQSPGWHSGLTHSPTCLQITDETPFLEVKYRQATAEAAGYTSLIFQG